MRRFVKFFDKKSCDGSQASRFRGWSEGRLMRVRPLVFPITFAYTGTVSQDPLSIRATPSAGRSPSGRPFRVSSPWSPRPLMGLDCGGTFLEPGSYFGRTPMSHKLNVNKFFKLAIFFPGLVPSASAWSVVITRVNYPSIGQGQTTTTAAVSYLDDNGATINE